MFSFIKKHFFAFLLLISVPIFLKPSIHGNDGILNYVYLRSMIIDGDIDFFNDYQAYDEITDNAFKLSEKPVSPVTDQIENRYGIGSSMLWAPFWLLAKFANDYVLPGEASQFEGSERIFEYAVGIASAFYGLIGLYMLFKIAEKFWGRNPAILASFFLWLTTPLFFYIYLHPSMSHANAFFLSAAVYAIFLLPDKIKLSHFAAAGFIAGYLAITRLQDILFILPAPFLCMFITETEFKKSFLLKGIILFAILFLVAMLPQFLAWKFLYGSYFSGPAAYMEYKEFKIYYPRHFFSVLFSSKHGMLFWHPFLLIGLIGLLMKNLPHKKIRLCFFIGFIFELWLISCWSEWSAGASFGHRLFISAYPAILFGTAAFISKTEKYITLRRGLILIIILTMWNLGLIFQYGHNMIPREDYVSYKKIIKNQFVEIPKYFIHK